MLQAGIVGLPNVGKSTLFNALTRSRKAEAANYPFCTIEPNVGRVEVPDPRLAPLATIAKTPVIIPAALEIVDIAGLVAGASKGEGLGNQFLANIREVDAIIQVVRCFEDDDVIHTMGAVDPIRDIEIIMTELILADLQSAIAQVDKLRKKARGADKEAQQSLLILEPLIEHLNAGKPAITFDISADDKPRLKTFALMSAKPILFACNVSETDLLNPDTNPFVQKVRHYAATHHGAECCVLSAKLEAELADLSIEESKDYLQSMGIDDSGVSYLIRATYHLLGLASYFTAGEKEVHAWTFPLGFKAPQCAGVIHTDFEKGFIKAEVVAYEDLLAFGSMVSAREAGKVRLEGKDYVFKDGDVALFRFSTH
jgi:GTP-binding protein YchF